jgi:hypothetical protein
VRRTESLTVRQVEVLQWIAEGCPDGVWQDFTYKTTALALASRGLVTVDRRRNHWSAALTEAGGFYLQHGRYPTDPTPAGESAADTAPGVDSFTADLLHQLVSGAGQVTVESPTQRQRARYRRAIHHLITSHEIPDGYVLRHHGRDQGDLTIRLVRAVDAATTEPALKVDVPHTDAEVSPEVRALVAGMRMAVTEPTMPRAMHILQAIANENTRRGWTLQVDPHDDRRFQITTPECSFDLALREELVDRDVPDDAVLDAAKYSWQRIPLQARKVGSGRLTLQLGQYYRARTWSDRRRWTLDDKLGAFFAELDARVAQATEERHRRDEDLLRRQKAWDAATLDAQRVYIIDLNRRRLQEHVNANSGHGGTATMPTHWMPSPTAVTIPRRRRPFARGGNGRSRKPTGSTRSTTPKTFGTWNPTRSRPRTARRSCPRE